MSAAMATKKKEVGVKYPKRIHRSYPRQWRFHGSIALSMTTSVHMSPLILCETNISGLKTRNRSGSRKEGTEYVSFHRSPTAPADEASKHMHSSAFLEDLHQDGKRIHRRAPTPPPPPRRQNRGRSQSSKTATPETYVPTEEVVSGEMHPSAFLEDLHQDGEKLRIFWAWRSTPSR